MWANNQTDTVFHSKLYSAASGVIHFCFASSELSASLRESLQIVILRENDHYYYFITSECTNNGIL